MIHSSGGGAGNQQEPVGASVCGRVRRGSLQSTGNPLDVALVGDGFFKVRTPNGDFMTRSGSFTMASDGRLLTEQGFEVLGGDSPITIPPANRVTIDANGAIFADGNGASG